MYIAVFASISKNVDSLKLFNWSQLSLGCLCAVVILFSFCCEIVKVDLNDDGNSIFISQNTFRQNLDRSVDSEKFWML